MAERKTPIGCFYFVWLGIVCAVLLVMNISIVGVIVSAFPDLQKNIKVVQLLQYSIPIVLIFVEFWIFDRLTDRMDRGAEQWETDE